MELPEQKPDYFSLLPKDIRNLTTTPLFDMPYPEVLKYPEEIKLIPNFWLIKAAGEVGENPNNSEFINFFNNYQTENEIYRYLRILAYDGIIVPAKLTQKTIATGTSTITVDSPGSAAIVDIAEICRHTLKDEKLIYYFFYLLTDPAFTGMESFQVSMKYMLETICRIGNVDFLIKFMKHIGNRQLPQIHSIISLLYGGASLKQLQELQGAIPREATGKTINANFIEQIKMLIAIKELVDTENYAKLKRTHDVIIAICLTLAIIEKREELVSYIKSLDIAEYLIDQHLIDGYIITENLEKLEQLTQIIWSDELVNKIVEKDSIPLYETVYKGIESDNRVNFSNLVKAKAFYNSKLFNHITEYDESILVNQFELIPRSYLDFAGLATIYEHTKAKINIDNQEINSRTWNEIRRTLYYVYQRNTR